MARFEARCRRRSPGFVCSSSKVVYDLFMSNVDAKGFQPLEFLLAKLDDLQSEWNYLANSGQGKLVVRAKKVNGKRTRFDRTQSALLLGYCAHIMQLAISVRLLLAEGHAVQSIPLVRLIYETSLTQNWVYISGPDAPRAIANEYGRSRKNLQTTMKESNVPYLVENADSLAGLDYEALETTSQEQARFVYRMIDDFKRGNDLYSYYRMLSEYCHPSVTVADLYLSSPEPGDGNGMPIFSSTPSDFPSNQLAYFTLFSACRAVYALTTTLTDHRAKNSIRLIARECDVVLDMVPSDEPVKRRQKAKQK